jgi:hypothetical protein
MNMGGKNPYNLDSGESAFFNRELEYVKTRTYDTKYKALKAFDLIPISTEAGNGVTTITYRKFTQVGLAKIIADYAHDFPRVDVYGEEASVKVKGVGDSYGYSIKEIRESQRTGKRLDQRRAVSARRAIEEVINTSALLGHAASGLNGLINYPGITEYTVPADGTGSSKLWSTKTPDQIIRDITGLINAVINPTSAREQPDTLLLPVSKYLYIANTRMGTVSDVTILQYLLKNNTMIKKVDWLKELEAAGSGGVDRMFVYPMDEEHLTLELPQPFEQFAPQQKGMEFEIPCHAETAGVIVYYPLAIAYGDGI